MLCRACAVRHGGHTDGVCRDELDFSGLPVRARLHRSGCRWLGVRRLPGHQCDFDDTRWACVHRTRCLRPIAIDNGDVPAFPYPWTNGPGGVRVFRHRDCVMGHRRQIMILSQLTDRRSHLKLHYRLPTEGASGFRTARRSLVLLAAQSQAPDSQATQLKVDEEIHALCEALIASERQPGP